jgi:hypothetical protein
MKDLKGFNLRCIEVKDRALTGCNLPCFLFQGPHK